MNGSFVLFEGEKRLAEGTLSEIASAAWQSAQIEPASPTLAFNRQTGEIVDLNLSGTLQDVEQRYAPQVQPRGRPKLGVTAREITLLPQHWEWLAKQPGGASVALRRLVDAARKDNSKDTANRETVEATYRFMSAIAGDLPNFENAARALFAKQKSPFSKQISNWPSDIQDELKQMSAGIKWPDDYPK